MLDLSDNEDNCIFPLTENLSSSYVDTSKLISYARSDEYPIGMTNFKSKKAPLGLGRTETHFQKHQLSHSLQPTCAYSPARLRWKTAVSRVKYINDPWHEFNLDLYPAETCVRHRYNAIKKVWTQDECTVKMESKQFEQGAMRACFRLKKLSNSVHKDNWQHASNYVAKEYMDSAIPRERYFEDVKLQMEAKLWAEIYNRHNPPKKIDMFQVSVLEFKNRAGSPLFHLEHFIDGKYIKYNSNSGFVDHDSSQIRFTPQAFSHFTFECSNHTLMVVDIQGVGDLYTDPQIHSASGTDYGDGNLGVKGFALFFSSHICNDVCKSLGLSQFDLASSELKRHEKIIHCLKRSLSTQSRGSEEQVVGSPSSFAGEYFRHRIRYRSENSMCSDDNNSCVDLPDIDESEGYESSSPSPNAFSSIQNSPFAIRSMASNPIAISAPMLMPQRVSRVRNESSCLDSAFSVDEAANYFRHIEAKRMFKPRPSCVLPGNQLLHHDEDDDSDQEDDDVLGLNNFADKEEESILGKVHLELCKYHEMGRFIEDESENFDQEAAFFHLEQASKLGVIEALSNIAKIYLQLPHDILSSYKVEESEKNMAIGFDYMLQNAEKKDKNSVYYVAKAYDSGTGLPKPRTVNWSMALDYYKKVLDMCEEEAIDDDSGYGDICTECEPCYIILARMAEMYDKGGPSLTKDYAQACKFYTQAADKAMEFGKGRLANKYYMLAEQASSMLEGEE